MTKNFNDNQNSNVNSNEDKKWPWEYTKEIESKLPAEAADQIERLNQWGRHTDWFHEWVDDTEVVAQYFKAKGQPFDPADYFIWLCEGYGCKFPEGITYPELLSWDYLGNLCTDWDL